MKFDLSRIRVGILSVALISVVALGTVHVSQGAANSRDNESNAVVPAYPKNKNGQTYGSGLLATSIDTEPDLIQAYGVDGTLGYVRSVDLNGLPPKTPEEAIAHQKAQANRVRQIPLYAVDGQTVIGVFEIGGETATEHSDKPK